MNKREQAQIEELKSSLAKAWGMFDEMQKIALQATDELRYYKDRCEELETAAALIQQRPLQASDELPHDKDLRAALALIYDKLARAESLISTSKSQLKTHIQPGAI